MISLNMDIGMKLLRMTFRIFGMRMQAQKYRKLSRFYGRRSGIVGEKVYGGLLSNFMPSKLSAVVFSSPYWTLFVGGCHLCVTEKNQIQIDAKIRAFIDKCDNKCCPKFSALITTEIASVYLS